MNATNVAPSRRSQPLVDSHSVHPFWLTLVGFYMALLPFERLWTRLLGEESIFKPYRVVGLCLLVGWTLRGLARGGRIILDSYDRSFMVLFTWGALLAGFQTIFAEGDLKTTVNDGQLIFFAFLVHLAIKSLVTNTRAVERVVWVYVIALTASVILSLAFDPDPIARRFRGFYSNPTNMGYGASFAALVLVCRFLLQDGLANTKRLLFAGAAVGFVVLLLLSGSRACILGLVIAFVALVLVLKRSRVIRARKGQRAALGLMLLIATALAMPRMIRPLKETSVSFDRYAPTEVMTLSGRLDIWRAAALLAADTYFIGVGMGQYQNYHGRYIAQLDHLYSPHMGYFDHLSTHSDLVSLLTEYGLLGLIIYLRLTSKLFIRSWRASIVGAGESYAFPVVFLIYCLALVVQLARDSFINPEFFVLLALVAICARRIQKPAGSVTPRRG